MAYTDLVSSQVTLVPGGGNYNFSFDTPIAADGSPHIVSWGPQLNATAVAGAMTPTNGLSGMIGTLRVQVGSEIVINWNNNGTPAAGTLSQFGAFIQRLGGQDFCITDAADDLTVLAELSMPVGLDASKSHRVNVQITLLDENAFMTGQALVAANSTLDWTINYGVAKERTIVGARQDFQMTAAATRTVTVFGREGFSMLGMMCASANNNGGATAVILDAIQSIRINNGAFRELFVNQWRSLNNSFRNPDRTSLAIGNMGNVTAAGVMAEQTRIAGQAGSLFLNLRRISAGANIDAAFTYTAANGDAPLAIYPVWVANIGATEAKAPRQTIITPQSTTLTVEDNSAN
jgi:hypothetical protein